MIEDTGAQALREPRNDRLTVMLTASERADVQLLKLHGVRPTEGDVLRDLTLEDIRERATRIRNAVRASVELQGVA